MVAIPAGGAHSAAMYDGQQGSYHYSVARHALRSGKIVWTWEVRHREGRHVVSGICLKSLDAAKRAALQAISTAPYISCPGDAPLRRDLLH
jgi:hypothetical protein